MNEFHLTGKTPKFITEDSYSADGIIIEMTRFGRLLAACQDMEKTKVREIFKVLNSLNLSLFVGSKKPRVTAQREQTEILDENEMMKTEM